MKIGCYGNFICMLMKPDDDTFSFSPIWKIKVQVEIDYPYIDICIHLCTPLSHHDCCSSKKKIIKFDIKRKWTNERKKKCFRHIARLEFKIKSISTTLVSLYFILAAFFRWISSGAKEYNEKKSFLFEDRRKNQ